MKIAIGILLCVCGIGVGLYVGLWLMLIGGIVQVIEAVKATPVDSWGVAVGAVRFLFAGAAGGLGGAVLFIPGMVVLQDR